ncbi:MAG: putative oxidoreductase, aryl-alcohol dehydrogenase like protein [Frankiales bacterium]|nr:putative oxidoreductase, aryl-alcohol dehydrogenase like protein [Frankiales bacterium]
MKEEPSLVRAGQLATAPIGGSIESEVQPVRYTRLGKTDLNVSVLALGTWAFGGDWGSFDKTDAESAINSALDNGITLFDTAQAYGFGAAEQLLGESLWKRVRRDEVIVATKGGLRVDGTALVRDTSARWLRAGVEASLRNLSTDYIDLYQVHWPDPATPDEETASALNQLVSEGMIRHIGVSNYDAKQLEALSRHGRVETLQTPYHMFRRDIEAEILPYTAANDIGVLAYGPLAHGLLAGHMTFETTFPPDDWRSHSRDFVGATFRRNLDVVAGLNSFAAERGIPLPQLAVAWTVDNPAVDVAVVGARRAEQLDALIPAAEVQLSAHDVQTIHAILADAAPVTGASPEGM